jgi:dGTPase
MSDALACYAVTEERSRQRRFPEKPHPYRSDFERDRDRIIHCEAFRRLEGKTQVFTPGVNDHYRNRLTHSIEVAQIGRTIAKALKVNESLTEAVCLGHDLGHSPFGHRGEEVLNELMCRLGGFEHNRQTLRIVDLIERPYPDFTGLNLMYETRLSFALHHSPYDTPIQGEFGELCPSVEGQIADLADRIAYNCHDLEDGMRARLIDENQLRGIRLFETARIRTGANDISDNVIRRIRTAKSMIDILVSDCIDNSAKLIRNSNVNSPTEIYRRGELLIKLSSHARKNLEQLEQFLFDKMYDHEVLQKANSKVAGWLKALFEKLCSKPELMPGYYQNLTDEFGLERTVCDYIAGMTDRFCLSMLEEIS